MRVIELKQWYMISVREAAERVHRDPETIRRWIRSGRLPSQRVGIRYIVDEHDLLAMVDAESLLLPPSWQMTASSKPVPDIVRWLECSRRGR